MLSSWFFLTICFRFYPYLLAISCIFLLITIMVYSSYKKLLNNYTRILRYYCITMFLAFIVLSMDQFRLSELNSFDCKVSGNSVTYKHLKDVIFVFGISLIVHSFFRLHSILPLLINIYVHDDYERGSETFDRVS